MFSLINNAERAKYWYHSIPRWIQHYWFSHTPKLSDTGSKATHFLVSLLNDIDLWLGSPIFPSTVIFLGVDTSLGLVLWWDLSRSAYLVTILMYRGALIKKNYGCVEQFGVGGIRITRAVSNRVKTFFRLDVQYMQKQCIRKYGSNSTCVILTAVNVFCIYFYNWWTKL